MTIHQIKTHLQTELQKAIQKEFGIKNFEVNLITPPSVEMGDFAFECFELAKLLKKSPQECSKNVTQAFRPDYIRASSFAKATEDTKALSYIDRVEVKGPYLNFFVKKDVLFKAVIGAKPRTRSGLVQTLSWAWRLVVIEFCSPNTNKPLHLGHLRNIFLGESTARLFEYTGHKVKRVQIINDRGIHICKAMLAYQKWGKGKTPQSEKKKGDHFVGDYYVLFEKKAKENPKLIEEAQELLQKWEAEDKDTIKLWKQMNKWVYDGMNKTLKRLGIKFDKNYYESDTYKIGKEIILNNLNSHRIYKREDGAIEADLEPYGLDKKVLIRADGTSVYITQDIGLAKLRFKEFKNISKMIYVVAREQEYHFRVLFKILELLGYKNIEAYHHLSYGLVNLPSGRMKSREGNVVDADDILDEVTELANQAANSVIPSAARYSPVPGEARDLAGGARSATTRGIVQQIVGLGALKYYLLRVDPRQDITYNPEESVSFDGATGPYIQYAYARIQSIIRKAPKNVAQVFRPAQISSSKELRYTHFSNEELTLLRDLMMFDDVITRSLNEYNPAHLATYLLTLAQDFNTFYHKHSVLKAESPKLITQRLFIIKAVGAALKKGLNLLGIDAPQRM